MEIVTREQLASHLVEILNPVVRGLVDSSDAVRITAAGRDTVMVSVDVAPEDRGQVIGRQGKTAEALRTIVNAVSSKYKMRALVEVVEG